MAGTTTGTAFSFESAVLGRRGRVNVQAVRNPSAATVGAGGAATNGGTGRIVQEWTEGMGGGTVPSAE